MSPVDARPVVLVDQRPKSVRIREHALGELEGACERVLARVTDALGRPLVAGAGRAVPAGRARESYHEARCALEARELGEAGTAGAPGAVMNAINDALAPLGAEVWSQPITPEKVKAAIKARTA